jgi:hypothetical protein
MAAYGNLHPRFLTTNEAKKTSVGAKMSTLLVASAVFFSIGFIMWLLSFARIPGRHASIVRYSWAEPVAGYSNAIGFLSAIIWVLSSIIEGWVFIIHNDFWLGVWFSGIGGCIIAGVILMAISNIPKSRALRKKLDDTGLALTCIGLVTAFSVMFSAIVLHIF